MFCFIAYFSGRLPSSTGYFFVFLLLLSELVLSDLLSDPPLSFLKTLLPLLNRPFTLSPTFLAGFFDSTFSNIKYIDNQIVTVIKIQMICKCKYKTI